MIIEQVKLPSAGLLGYPAEVTIRELVGGELSAVYHSLNDAAINYILTNGAVKGLPEDFDFAQMCDQDVNFLLHKLRQITIGNTINQMIKSPFSGKIQKVEVSYEDFNVVYLTEEQLAQTHTFKDLDGKEYVVHRRIPSKAIYDDLILVKEKHMIPSNDDAILRILAKSYIKDANNKTLPAHDAVHLLSTKTPGRELVKIFKFVDALIFGLSTTYPVLCEDTKNEFMGVLSVSDDLFR